MVSARLQDAALCLAKLQSLGSKTTAKRVLRKGLAAAAAPIVKAAKRNAPKVTGTLRKSITKKVKQRDWTAYAVVGANKDATGPTVGGQTRVPSKYDHLVELGFKHKGGKVVPGQHWLQQAFEATKSEALNQYTEKLIAEVEAVALGPMK